MSCGSSLSKEFTPNLGVQIFVPPHFRLGFLKGLVPFAAAKSSQEVPTSGTWPVQGSEELQERVSMWWEDPTEMVVQSQVILDVHRAH